MEFVSFFFKFELFNVPPHNPRRAQEGGRGERVAQPAHVPLKRESATMTLDKIRVSGPRPSGPAGRSRPRERNNFRARTFAKVALLTRSFFFFFFFSSPPRSKPSAEGEGGGRVHAHDSKVSFDTAEAGGGGPAIYPFGSYHSRSAASDFLHSFCPLLTTTRNAMVTSVAFPLAFAATGALLLTKGVYHMTTGTGKLD